MCKEEFSFRDPRRRYGFRLWVSDMVVILACFPATWLLWRWFDEQALMLPLVLGHFFLFCNVFRVRRRLELWWAAALVVNGLVWIGVEDFGLLEIWIVQTPVTLVVIGITVAGRDYRGIGCRKKAQHPEGSRR